MRPDHSLLLHSIGFACLAVVGLRAQCDPVWLGGSSLGASDRVRAATLWDPDGAGPQLPRLVVAGDFAYIADALVPLLAAQDPTTGQWQAIGGGVAGYSMHEVAALTTGELVVSGVLTLAGSSHLGIARFDGSSWSWLSTSFSGDVLLPQANGTLLAANNALPQSQWVGTVDRWDGSNWSQVAPAVDGRIAAMVQMPNGDLVVGGQFTSAGGVAAQNIARWNGSTWAPLGAGCNSAVNALAVLPNGDVVAGGYLTQAGGQPAARIARWDGAAWHAFGSGIWSASFPAIWSLQTLANGDLIAGGYFNSIDNVPAACVARLHNGVWSDVGVGVDHIVDAVVELPNGDLVAVGAFLNTAGGVANRLARWDGASWSSFGVAPPCNGTVTDSAVATNGDLWIAGGFTQSGGVAAQGIARRTAAGWQAVGSGANGTVAALVAMPDGDIVIGGTFTTVDGVPAQNLARWHAGVWSQLGGGLPQSVRSLFALPDGKLLVGGLFSVAGSSFLAQWDGIAWAGMGAGPTQSVEGIAKLANGDILVASSFSIYQSRIERWDGANWSTLADLPTSSVLAIQAMPSGDVMFGGFLPGPGLLRWDGATFQPMQLEYGSTVRALQLLPNGDLVAAGELVFGGNHYRVARWNGVAWIGLEASTLLGPNTLALLPNGELVAGGPFSTIDGKVSPNLATLVTPCPAAAVPFGAGCVGSSGIQELHATALPWVGSAFRGRATGMPPNSFVATVSGFTPLAVPLTLLFAEAGVGCIGHCSAEAIDLALPVAGEVATQIVVPNDAALVGVTFDQYVLAFEFDPLGTLLAVTSTNGLAMTVGTW